MWLGSFVAADVISGQSVVVVVAAAVVAAAVVVLIDSFDVVVEEVHSLDNLQGFHM